MDKLDTLIQRLEARISNVLAQYKNQQTAIQKLESENQTLKQQISHLHKVKHSHEGNLFNSGDKQKEDLERRIDHYIEDIERTIAYLEKLQSWKSSQ